MFSKALRCVLSLLSITPIVSAQELYKLYDSREPLAEFPDKLFSLDDVSILAKFRSHAQYFRGGFVFLTSDSNFEQVLHWTDGKQTRQIIPPPITYKGIEYAGNEGYANPTIQSHASDGERLFMNVWYWSEFSALASFIMFDGEEFHTIEQDLFDLPFYDGKGSLSTYDDSPPMAHTMTAASGRAVFTVSHGALLSEDGQDTYEGLLYYNGDQLIEIQDNRDPYPVEGGFLSWDLVSSDTLCFISPDGESFAFTAYFGDNSDKRGLFFSNLDTIETVYLSGQTEFNGTTLGMIDHDLARAYGDKVIFYAEWDNYYNDPTFFSWTPENGIQSILSYDLGIYQEISMTYASDKLMLVTAQVRDPNTPFGVTDYLDVTYEYDFLNSEINAFFYDSPTEIENLAIHDYTEIKNLANHGYIYGTAGETFAFYERLVDDDDNLYSQLWISFEPSLDIPDSTSVWYSAASDLGDGWNWLPWLGSFNVSQTPWIFHLQHGWLYPFGDDPATGMFFWDVKQESFLYTTNSLYPTMFRFADNKWIRYQIGSSAPRWFVDLQTGVWESLE